VARLKPDVVHVHDADRLCLGGLAHYLFRTPLVYDSHEYFAGFLVDDTVASRIKHYWWSLLERLFVPRARAVITVSEPIGRKLSGAYGIAEVVIVRNFPEWRPAADGTRLRSALPAAYRGRPVLLFQGRLVPNRGVEVFIETLARLPEIAGVIIGGGPEQARLKTLAHERGLDGRLVFINQVPWEELTEYTAGADLGFYVQPNTCESWYLTLPNKVFEYLMAGVPVVASDYPVLRGPVSGEGVGVLVSPDDPDQIAAAVKGLLADPGRLAGMRENALRVARTTYNWESEAHTLAGLYRRLESQLGKKALCPQPI
jgi:glycosyltransferase involved in cell wall biosynthesis